MLALFVLIIVVRKEHSAAARQFAKQGCPTGLRKKVWMCILGMEMENLVCLDIFPR